MKSFVIALAVAFVAATSVPGDAEARRIGGGGAAGMQRSVPPRATPDAPAPGRARRAAAPRRPPPRPLRRRPPPRKRSWMGPIAGLAAGLGIAALMSHLGLGEAFGNFLTMLLLAVVAFFVIRFLMRRFGPKPATAGAGNGCSSPGARRADPAAGPRSSRQALRRRRQRRGRSAGRGRRRRDLPAGFDAEGFERIAKMIFIRMQAANDAGDLNDLRAFTTPEMFAAIRLDLQERGPTAQRTDVVRVDAEVLDVASEADRQIVSVRFHGLIREQIDGVAEPFDEVWHLVKPADGSREWAIAGIQQAAAARAGRRPLEAASSSPARRAAWARRWRAVARRRRTTPCSASPAAANDALDAAARESGSACEQWQVDLAEPVGVGAALAGLARGARRPAASPGDADQQRRAC